MDFCKRLFRNKKGGGLSEGIFIVIALTIIALIWVSVVYVLDVFDPIMEEDLQNSQPKAVWSDYHDRTPSNLDSAFVVILAVFWIFAIIFAVLIDSHPIWFTISLVGLILILAFAGILANVYDEFYTELELTSSLPMTYYVMTHLVEFILAITVSIFIALFGKSYT